MIVKIRYFVLRSALAFATLRKRVWVSRRRADGTGLSPIDHPSPDILARYTLVRYLNAIHLDEEGSEYKKSIPSLESFALRFFRRGETTFVCLLEPPRGGRIVTEALNLIFDSEPFSFESIDITHELAKRHSTKFDIAKLVSAKVKDFKVAKGAVGRLEVSSKGGLSEEIAPFLAGAEFQVDSLTYEVTHDFNRGLICYTRNGTVRVTGALAEHAFSQFEACLAEVSLPPARQIQSMQADQR